MGSRLAIRAGTLRGDFADAASLIAEARSLAAATGTRLRPYAAPMLAAFPGSEAEAAQLIDAAIADARSSGRGLRIVSSHPAAAVLNNGLARYEAARAEALQAVEQMPDLIPANLALPELIEAASRCGQSALAAGPLDRLAEATSIGETDWAQGSTRAARRCSATAHRPRGCIKTRFAG